MWFLLLLGLLGFGLENEKAKASVEFASIRNTLDIRYQALLTRPLEYFGYVGSGGEDEETLKKIVQDNANLLVVDFGWLGGFIVPSESDPRKAQIDFRNPRFQAFGAFLRRCSHLGLKNLVGIITCTNFHEYPEWFRKLYPDIYALDSAGNPEPLYYESGVPLEKRQFWTNVEHPVLNDLRKEFAEAVIRVFKGNKNIIAWGIDGETLYPPVPIERGFDQSKFALIHFRAYLKSKYKRIEELNNAWGTRYKDFGEVLPPKNFALNKANLDWHMFRVSAIGEYLCYLYDGYKRAEKKKFAFTWLHDMGLRDDELKSSGCAPFLYAQIGDGLIANPIVRPPKVEYNTKYFGIMTSFGKPVFSSQLSYFPRPWPGHMIRRQIYECLGLGLWGVGLVSWSWPEGYLINWGIKGTEGQSEAREVFLELRKLAPYLDMMWPVASSIGVFVSQPAWLMDGWKESWDNLHIDFLERQIPKRYICDWQILKGELERPELKVLISVDNDIVDKEVIKKIEKFVKRGGIFVIIGEFNKFDEDLNKPEEPNFWGKVEKRGRWGNLSHYLARYGAGQIIKIEGSYSTEVGGMLEKLLQNEVVLKPIMIVKGTPSLIKREKILDTTNGKQDLADDFSGNISLGQLITVPSDFIESLAISTPTYWKKVKDYGLRMEVFLNGPKGKKMGEREIPPEEITDNGWIEIVLNKELPKGTRLYLRVSPLKPLPPSTIGWWSLKIERDKEEGAFVNDEPVRGVLRRVMVKYKEREEIEKGIESFLLSDGVNVGIVLINTTGESFKFNFKIKRNFIPDKEGVYIIKEPLREKVIGIARGGNMEVPVSFSPYGTAFILLERETRKVEVERLLKEIKLKNDDIGKAFYGMTKKFMRGKRYCKALAGALHLKNLLLISSEINQEYIRLRIMDTEGKPVKNANLSIEVFPLINTIVPYREVEPGFYEIEFKRGKLPLVYDYQKGKYLPYEGGLVLRVKAFKGMQEGYKEIELMGY
ncbi:MAG: beta-galactosidase [bacterium]